MKIRSNNLDFLRIIATIMVIIIHVSATFVTQTEPGSFNFHIGNLFDSFSRVSVPLFVLMSGALNLTNKSNNETKEYYKKQVIRILIPVLIFSTLFFLLSLARIIYINNFDMFNISIKSWLSPFYDWFRGAPYYHLWYMYMYIGLIVITPLLIRIVNKINDNKKMIIFSFTFILLGFLIELTSELYWVIKFIPYIGYYLLGFSLIKIVEDSNKTVLRGIICIFVYIFSSLVICLLTYIMFFKKINIEFTNLYIPNTFFYSYLSPFVIIASISLFYGFILMPEIKVEMSSLSSHTFYIYLFHAGVLTILEGVLSIVFGGQYYFKFNPIIYISVTTFLVFFLSLILSYLTKLLMKSKPFKLAYEMVEVKLSKLFKIEDANDL